MALSKGATPIRIIDHPNPSTVIWRHFGFVPLDDESNIPNRRRAICKRVNAHEQSDSGTKRTIGH